MKALKQELYNRCMLVADDRISTAQNAITAAREASEDDTKSSAGDKYETTREMMQQEISRNEVQLQEAKKLKQSLLAIDPTKSTESVQAGSLVETSNGTFFLAIFAGNVQLEGKTIITISPASPIGKQLKSLKAGEGFTLNGREFRILAVY